MKCEEMLQMDVSNALKREPLKLFSGITATVSNGIVTLSAKVDCFSKKSEAENTVRKVAEEKAVIDKIEVMINSRAQKNDLEITAELLSAFRWNWNTLNDTTNVKVNNGWVTLSGELEWNYQREAAKTAASNLKGVKGVTNLITIQSDGSIEVHKATIERALKSHAALDGTNITVAISGPDVMLKGAVDSEYQKDLAGRIVWKAPGIITVYNELLVE